LVPYVDQFAKAKIGSWAVSLLGNIEQQPLRDAWDDPALNAGWASNANLLASIPGLICPTDNTNEAVEEIQARNSYAINVGFFPYFQGSQANALGYNGNLDSQILKATSKDNSVSYNAVPGTPGYRSTGLKSDGIRDGRSNTIWYAENLQAASWANVLPMVDASTSDDDQVRYLLGVGYLYRLEAPTDPGLAGNNGMLRAVPDQMMVRNRINGEKTFKVIHNASYSTLYEYARPSAAHAGVATASMVDGSTKKIDERIDYRVYQALITPSTAQSDSPYIKYILKSADLFE
jgi:hypothetical protein